MIGPSSSGEEQALQPPAAKRRALEELDIESICDEVCGHHHHHHHHHYHSGHRQQPAAKRPRYLLEPQPLEQLVDGATAVYAPLEPHYQYEHLMYHQQEDQLTSDAAPVARLEVLVVDGTWDDALESFQAAAATTPNQTCASSFAELTSIAAESNPHQPQPLQGLCFPDPYWSASQNPSPDSHQQQQQQSTMPKVQSAETGRSSRGGFGAQLQQPSAYEDQENGNLSWLLDFKLDSFIEAPEDKCTLLLPRDLQASRCKPSGSGNGRTTTTTTTPAYAHEPSLRKSCGPEQSGPRFEAASSAAAYGPLDNRGSRCAAAAAGGPKKPPFTYTELIEHALQERGELTVSAIYQWIS